MKKFKKTKKTSTRKAKFLNIMKLMVKKKAYSN